MGIGTSWGVQGKAGAAQRKPSLGSALIGSAVFPGCSAEISGFPQELPLTTTESNKTSFVQSPTLPTMLYMPKGDVPADNVSTGKGPVEHPWVFAREQEG